jgi:hypothetical protein
MAKLSISSDLSPEHLDLLEAAGFESDRDLLSGTCEAIHRELIKANEVLSLAEEVPTEDEIEAWLRSTREAGSPAARKEAKSAAKKTAKKAARKKARKPTKKPAEESEPPVAGPETGDEEPESDVEAGSEVPEEAIAGPVNFEADPDVQEMLDRAPVAIPIPNIQLAEAGIPPAEIEIAPVLNRAESDLDVHVTVKSERSSPVGTPRQRAAGIVQVADPRSGPKRGIDVSRVRHIDEAVAEPAPVVKPQLDERTRLIRTAREKTNRGKDPNSRRFVRGVLHDRGFLVFFGCVIVILFQISIPLAVVTSPLLILSQDPDGSFGWVPVWFIVFPIAVPLLGILYFLVSYRVKCRVCAQRVLAPRQCLKNKKAHHVPLLGHIMPLALHTIFFKWFNCTYCGTAVRIKE